MALALDVGTLNSRLSRENAQSGELTASLIWNDPADLDLHAFVKVRGKKGEEHIYYGNKKAAGGFLDVDMNVSESGKGFSLEPVENIFWTNAPGGEYRITVTNAGTKSHPTKWGDKYTDPKRDIPFKVFLNKDGEMEEFSGVYKHQTNSITCFTFKRDGPGHTQNYLVFPPSGSKTTFKELCTKHDIKWEVGCGHYAVARTEKIHAGKDMVLHDMATNTFTVGSEECRNKLGWADSGELKKGPKDIPENYRLYVQSTSYNRVIPGDTHVLFAVDPATYAQHQKTTTIPSESEPSAKAKAKGDAKAKAKGDAKAKAKGDAKAKAKADAKAKAKAKGKAAPKSGSKRPGEAPKTKAKAKARR